LCAVSPNNNEILIYDTNKQDSDLAKWTVKYRLKEHGQAVTALDWAPKTNRIVSTSQDRNAYVWEFKDNQWKPTLVLLKISRAALCCKWSPKENKFAVGSGTKQASVCYYDESNNWWVANQIKNKTIKHKSSVVSVHWHPTDNDILMTTSTDRKCRIFNAFIKNVDGKKSEKGIFGKCFGEFSANGWVWDAAFSPSGKLICYVSHDSTISFVEWETENAQPITTKISSLPLTRVMFLSEKAVVTSCFDYSPYIFTFDGKETKSIGRADSEQQSQKQESRVVNKFTQNDKKDATTPSTQKVNTRHKNVIRSFNALKESNGKVTDFSSCALDGRVFFWNTSELEKALSF